MASKKNGPDWEAAAQGPGADAPAATAGGEKITKKEAVRRSLKRLGQDAKPAAIQADIRERFGLDMTPGHITTTKGELRREAAKGKTAPRKAGRPPRAKREAAPAKADATRPAPAAAAGPVATSNSQGPAVLLEDILALKGLVQRRS